MPRFATSAAPRLKLLARAAANPTGWEPSPDRLTEHVERLAHHAVRGERWEKAVTYLRQAGAKALARSANREAVSCFEQALAALGHRPETREALEQAIDLRFDLRTSLFPLGEFAQLFGR